MNSTFALTGSPLRASQVIFHYLAAHNLSWRELHGFFRPDRNSQDFSRGQEKPDANSFFEPVAKERQRAGPIPIFDRGTGTGRELEQFVTWAKAKHPELAARIIGSQVIDEHHLADPHLLARGREFHAGALVP